jgi:thimet oligopeptidase
MNSGRTNACIIALLLIPFAADALKTTAQTPAMDPLHSWVSGTDPAALESWVNLRLAEERTAIGKLLAVTGTRTIENTLRPFDDAQNLLALANNNAYMTYSLAASAALRDKGRGLIARISSASTELSLNPKVFAALAAVPLPDNDPPTLHYLERSLLEYRLSGVDKDAATRARIQALQDKITALSLTFGRNVADGTLKIAATRAELDGLPADYIALHRPAADGAYTLTTNEPDRQPVMIFAKSADLRRRMFLAYNQRAYPQNAQVLKDLLAARQDLATTLGYANYADLATADQMMGTSSHVEAFLNQLDDASQAMAKREYGQLLAFAQQQQPGLTSISESDGAYSGEQYRRQKYDFDAQSVRPYFPYDEVQVGILKTAARLFHVTFKPVKNAVVWNPSVDTFDVLDAAQGSQGKLLGRIYLDMHPREGKDKWFSSAPLVPGIRGRQIPKGC